MRTLIEKIWRVVLAKFPWLDRFMKFGIVGASNTLISWVTYYGLLFLHIHYQIANITAFFVSVTNAYIWNKFWVFKDRPSNKKTPVKFITIYGGNLLFGISLAYLWVDILHWSEYIVPFFSLCITVPINFILNKNWTFANKNGIMRDGDENEKG